MGRAVLEPDPRPSRPGSVVDVPRSFSAARIRVGSGAGCVGLCGVLLAEDEEESTALGALSLGEVGEEVVFGVALGLRGAFELLDRVLQGDGGSGS